MKLNRIFIISLLIVTFVTIISITSFAQPLAGELPSPRVVTDRPLKVAFFTKGFEAESVQRNFTQFKIECAKRGWELIEVTSTLEKAADSIRALLETDVDAIVNAYAYFDYWLDEVKMAREQGVGVYSIDTETKPGVIVCPRQFDGAAGAKLMATLVDLIGYKGNVGILAYHMHEGVDRRTAAGEAIARWYEKKDVKLAEYQDITYPGYDTQGYNIAKTWADKYGSDMDAVFCGFDIPSIFAARAFESAGLTAEDVICGGIDGGKQALSAIRAPKNPFKVSFSQPFELYTHTTCEVIQKVQVDGESIEDALIAVNGSPSSGNVFLEGVLVTPTNVPPEGSTYYEVHHFYGEDPNDPDAWINWWKEVNIEPYRS